MLTNTDMKKVEATVQRVVIDALEQVTAPRFVEIENQLDGLKTDVTGLRSDVTQLQNDMYRVEKKLDQVTDHQAKKLEQHTEEIKHLKLALEVA